MSSMQVLDDYITHNPKSKDCLEKDVIEKGLSELTMLELKQYLNGVVDVEELERAKEKSSSAVEVELAHRRCNEAFFETLDNAMRHGVQVPMAKFREPQPLIKFIARGEKRIIKELALPAGEQGPLQKQMRISRPGGLESVVFPLAWKDDSHVPACHMRSDNGAVGRYGAKWSLYDYNIRGTHQSDLAHNIVSTKTDAESKAGLTIIHVEFRGHLNMRQGPHKPGGANHSILHGLSVEFFKRMDHNTVLFIENFDDICEANGWGALDYGSERHRLEGFERCKRFLLETGKTDKAVDGRWFCHEKQSRRAKGGVPIYRMLLMYMGFKRKWYKCATQSPLYIDDAEMDIDVDDDAMLMELIALAPVADGVGGGAPEAAAAAAAEDEAMSNHGEDGEEAGPAAAPASGSGGADGEEDDAFEEGVSRPGITKSAAFKEARKRRASAANNFKFNMAILGRRLDCSLWQGSCEVTVPVEKFFDNRLLPDTKTRRSGVQLQIDLCNGLLSNVAVETIGHVLSSDFAEKLGLSTNDSDAPTHVSERTKKNEVIVGSACWDYALHLAGGLMQLNLKHSLPPYCFGPLSDEAEWATWLPLIKVAFIVGGHNVDNGTSTNLFQQILNWFDPFKGTFSF